MTITQFRSTRKFTGGLYRKIRKKKKRDFGSDFVPAKLGEMKKKAVTGLAGMEKQRLVQANLANVIDLSTKKAKTVKILSVKENPSNIHFVRMGVISKGATIETELGLAKVTSRPGQHGIVNAVLIEKKK